MSTPALPFRTVAPIGPGRLVLVVGPSGAGKDTLIAGVKVACADNPAIVFPRRVVTRTSGVSEEHDTLESGAFDGAIAQGAFSFWWEAHGLKYGIPRQVDEDIANGRTAVCNISRAIVSDVRAHFSHVTTVLVTAPADLLIERLASRARGCDGQLTRRLQRNEGFTNFTADVVIENIGPPELGIQALLNVVAAP